MTNAQLLRIVRHIDLPHHARAEWLARFAAFYGTLLPPACAVLAWHLLARFLMPADPSLQVVLPAIAGGLWLFDFLGARMLNNAGRWAAIFAAIGGLIGGGIGYQNSLSDPDTTQRTITVLMYGLFGGFIGVFGVHALMIVHLVTQVVLLVGAPIAYVVGGILAIVANLLLKLLCPAWTQTTRKQWLVRFSHNGIARVSDRAWHSGTATQPVFVSHPKLRRNGTAGALGVPRFTLQTLTREPGLVARTMTAAAASVGGAVFADDLMTLPVLNPATGLPMVGDMHGGFDVGGNLYGANNLDMSDPNAIP